MKRKLDKQFYIYRPLFSSNFASRYHTFINLCFKPYGGPGHDARLRTVIQGPDGDWAAVSKPPWGPKWAGLFTDAKEATGKPAIEESYEQLMKWFSRELGVGLSGA